MKKQLLMLATLVVVVIIGFYAFNSYIYNEKQGDGVDPSLSSFDECIEAGYPSLDSYPEQCETPDGKRFVRNLPEDELEAVMSPIKTTGTLVCLPHWDTTGPQTMECAYGLLSDSGHYYIVREPAEAEVSIGLIPVDEHVEIEGTYLPGSHPRYQSIGTIEVESVRAVE